MIINLAKLMNSNDVKHRVSFIMDKLVLPEDIKLESPLEISLDIAFDNQIITVEGDFEVHLHSNCDRCIENASFALNVTIKEKLIKQSDLCYLSNLSQETIDEEYQVLYSLDLDLTDLVTENIILNLPTKILCSEACKGICPYCGKNLNKEKCNCANEQIDPRLAILAEFKK
ncbi:uncharacterized protein SAMN00017405_0057 [Desulfonispora thiosulfatigenes DSM 11270]|uniref:DUF177 domain-containing protein n=1 Tax=Desulfonispora thiosulfatigenes DSM 11270 TaxID=656914 RepID=A0A1W1VJT0_DESTI|nr:YceD family protein [Desulfonispora thiosulfatigenes]SMB93588.1 uncharacterized protein SAMN00017405_0057 [Desulfonispora thiosulfatigenes DSM 11270]